MLTAEYALKEIQLLYRIEHDCDERGLTMEQRKDERTKKARPIMEAMKLWMETEGIKYSPNSLIGKAITYAYTRWNNMMRYLDDGRIRIDNNLAENAIRPITLGRKNYLFCGNHEAAVSMSVVCSLLATCKAHEVNPRDYLNDVIARMPYMQKATNDELLQLLPHKWKKESLYMAKAAYPTIGIAAFVMFGIVYFIGCLRFTDGYVCNAEKCVMKIPFRHLLEWGRGTLVLYR